MLNNDEGTCIWPSPGPGSLSEPYHIPGYTGHIPTMRYRHGSSFSQTSRYILEDPRVPQAPVPVLIPKQDPGSKNYFSDVPPSKAVLQRGSSPSQSPRRRSRNSPQPQTAKNFNSSEKLREYETRPLESDSPKQFNQQVTSETFHSPHGPQFEIFQLPCWPPQPCPLCQNIPNPENSETFRPYTAESSSCHACNSDLSSPAAAPTKSLKRNNNYEPRPPISRKSSSRPNQISSSSRPLTASRQCSRQASPSARKRSSFSINIANSSTPPPRPQTCSDNYDATESFRPLTPVCCENNIDLKQFHLPPSCHCGPPEDPSRTPPPPEPVPEELFPERKETLTENRNRSPYAKPESADIDTTIYRCKESLPPRYSGHVPGYSLHSFGRSYGKATLGTKDYLDKWMDFNNSSSSKLNK